MVDRCAVCGDPVPEGRQICPICEDIKARGKTMISAWWLIPAAIGGAFFGILLLAVVNAGGKNRE